MQRRSTRPRPRLNKDGRAGVQKVIIILSDGAANTGPGYLSANSPYRTTPCHQAINEAAASKAAKVLMYSIAYDIGGAGNDYCYNDNGNLEVPNIKAAATLQQIASPGNYYAQPQPAQLTTIFLAISADLAAGTHESTAEPGTRAVRGAGGSSAGAPKSVNGRRRDRG